MLILWGFRTSTTVIATMLFVCGNCHSQGAHHLSKRVRKFTLFFIPLFPVSTKYHDTCTVCGHVMVVPKEQAITAASQQGRAA